MKNRNRNLLALALATALLSQAAWAEKGGKGADPVPNDPARTTGSTVSDAARTTGQAVDDVPRAAGQSVSQTAREANPTMNDAASDEPQATPPQRSVHERMVKNPTNTETTDLEKPTPPVPPTQSQGADNAAAHSSVTRRELWGRLDTDHDGQISAAESAVDAEFNAGFQAMDTNDDGLLTDAEYQVAARAEVGSTSAQGGVNAASHSAVSVRDLLGRLDANGDGSISTIEGQADAGFSGSFSTIDANSDGMVSSDEYRAWTKAQRK